MKIVLNEQSIFKRLDNYVSEELRNFLNDNRDVVFTAEKELECGLLKLYSLKEDNHSPKYIFYEKDFVVVEAE